MQTTQIVYRKMPSRRAIAELKSLIPNLQIEWIPFTGQLSTVIDPYYKIKVLDWAWFRTLFGDVDVACLLLEKPDLKGVGIDGHWGFYSLADDDLNHQFYMTNYAGLDYRAKANGFASNFAWQFTHEYLHGVRWGQTFDRQKAAQDVHDWEAQGILKQKLAEHLELYKGYERTLTEQTSIFARLKSMFVPSLSMFPKGARISQGYGIANIIYKLTGHHIGTDVAVPVGTPITATEDCVITHVGNLPKSLGNYCEVNIRGKFIVLCHLQELPLVGRYAKGAVLAYSGNTGMSTGPHCHIEGWHATMDRSKLTPTTWQTLTFNPQGFVKLIP